MKRFVITALAACTLIAPAIATDLSGILSAAHREPANVVRDGWRHPQETLSFFGVKPEHAVVEIWPGAGWYTEILAPYLRDHGKLYVAHFNTDSKSEYYRKVRDKFAAKLSDNPSVYARVAITEFDAPAKVAIAPAASADVVLTFRNVHNWWMRGGGDARVQSSFKAMFDALKPGGTLGVVEHRLPAARPATDQEDSGYMHEAYVIKMAEAVGFKLAAKSEINANPKDTADHEKGVWALPPTLTNGEKDKAKYQAIGESDRMTLRFTKP